VAAASSRSIPTPTNTGTYEEWSTTHPVKRLNTIPPKPAPMLAMPQMEPTVLPGNRSAGIANMFASAPEYPSVAIEIRPIETDTFDTSTAGIAEVMSAANSMTEILRAHVTLTPRLSMAAAQAPPSRLPAPAVKNGIQANLPTAAMSKPRALFRYCGNQKI